MGLIFLTLLLILICLLVLAGVVRSLQGHSVSDLLDWKPTRSFETEAELEIDDVQQMIDAQNELRRRRGAPEITEADVRRQAAEDERIRMRGSGPFSPDQNE